MSIKLKTNDGKILEVNIEVAKQSETIKDMMELFGDIDEPLAVPTVNGATLEKIIEWCTHEQSKPEKERFHGDVDYIKQDDWTNQYFQVDNKMLRDVLNAANFLNINSLAGWSSFFLYKLMKGKTAEEIRKIFNMKNNLPAYDLEDVD